MSILKNLQVLPLYHDSEYKHSFREIVYYSKTKNNTSVYDYKSTPCRYDLVDHKDFRIDDTRFKEPPFEYEDSNYIAYGILINIYNTRILPIDIDIHNLENIIKNTELLLKDDRFTGADIIISSQNRWHVMVGIKEFSNIRHILPFIPNICHGYVKCCQDRREAVLRVSQKFLKDKQSEPPIYYYGLRKDENQEIVIASKFIFPQPNIQSIQLEKKRTVRLRNG